MKLSVSVGDTFIDYDDENPNTTLDGVESVLDRLVNAAVTAHFAVMDGEEDYVLVDDELDEE